MPTDTETFSVEFTKDEAEALVKLIDRAVQAAGLQVAEQAVYFHQKINKAYRISRKVAPVPDPEPAPIV